jgi:hypothetical protein
VPVRYCSAREERSGEIAGPLASRERGAECRGNLLGRRSGRTGLAVAHRSGDRQATASRTKGQRLSSQSGDYSLIAAVEQERSVECRPRDRGLAACSDRAAGVADQPARRGCRHLDAAAGMDYNRGPVVDSARTSRLVSGLLFVAFVIAFVGLAATAGMHSLLLTLACAAGVGGTLGALAAWTLVTHDRGEHSDSPRRVAWHPHQWAEFERAFWSYVDGSWDASPRATE